MYTVNNLIKIQNVYHPHTGNPLLGLDCHYCNHSFNMSLCLTCSSSLVGDLDMYRTLCCDKPICTGCLRRNPRLKEYDPCLWCGDLRTSAGLERLQRGQRNVEEARRRRENVFEIGDEDEDGEDRRDDQDGNEVEPPKYEDDREIRDGRSDDWGLRSHNIRILTSVVSPTITRGSASADSGVVDEHTDNCSDTDRLEVVEVRHPVSKSDTLLSIARKYAADVSTV